MKSHNSQIIFDFTVGHCNGTMSMVVSTSDGARHEFGSFDNDRCLHELSIRLPNQVILEFQGKGAMDTEVDSQGKIIADKFMRLDKLTVDKIVLDADQLYHILELETPTGKIKGNYFGFNGRVVLDFDTNDSFAWLLAQKSQQQQPNITLALTTDQQHLDPWGTQKTDVFRF